LSLFALLIALIGHSLWQPRQAESRQLGSEGKSGAPTAADIKSALEMIPPVLDQLSAANADAIGSPRSNTNATNGDRPLLDADSDPAKVAVANIKSSEQKIEEVKLLIQRLQNDSLAFNGPSGFELDVLLSNILEEYLSVLNTLEYSYHYWLLPRNPRKAAKIRYLANEYSEICTKLGLSRDVNALWFRQYLRSVEGVATRADEDTSSRTRLAIQQLKRRYGRMDSNEDPR